MKKFLMFSILAVAPATFGKSINCAKSLDYLNQLIEGCSHPVNKYNVNCSTRNLQLQKEFYFDHCVFEPTDVCSQATSNTRKALAEEKRAKTAAQNAAIAAKSAHLAYNRANDALNEAYKEEHRACGNIQILENK